MPKEIKEKITDILETMTSYYFKGGDFEDQDLYCEDIADKILEELAEKIEKMKKKCKIIDYENGKPVEEYFCQTYNKAISKVLKLLK